MGLFDSISNTLPGVVLSAGAQIAKANALSHLPPGVGSIINTGVNVADDLLSGDISAAVGDVVSSGLLTSKFPRLSGAATQAHFLTTPNRLFGGITPLEAKQMYSLIAGVKYAFKNLFFITVSELNPQQSTGGDPLGLFNFFATEIDYASITLSGEKRKAGSATLDSVHSREAIELRITTLDDVSGTLKQWFRGKARIAAPSDGTVGVPFDYLVKITIRHAVVSMESARAEGSYGIVFGSTMLMRPVSQEHSMSRRETHAQEVNMTFTEFDTFHPAI